MPWYIKKKTGLFTKKIKKEHSDNEKIKRKYVIKFKQKE